MTPVEQRFANRFIGGVVCALAAYIALSSFRTLSESTKLMAGCTNTAGVITSQKEGMHGIVDYSFKVSGREYRARDVGAAQREFGARVEVFYCKDDPSISSLHDPKFRRRPGWGFVIVPFGISCLGLCVATGWINLNRLFST